VWLEGWCVVYIIVFVCSGCGLELFRHVSSPLRPDPRRVVKLYGGKCPRCGRKLETPGGGLKFSAVKEYKSVRVHPHIEVYDLQRVEDGLPSVKSVYFIFSGDKVVKVDAWRYDVIVVGYGHDHVIGIIEVIMFGDRCFIMKDIDKHELEGAVSDIVIDLLEGLQEGEV
jgi:hypothetical protein